MDLVKAVDHGRVHKSILDPIPDSGLQLQAGWDAYTTSIAARKSLEGLSAKTPKRYRAVWDKFKTFCEGRGVTHCHQITKALLSAYAAWLDDEGYAYATEYLEITTLKQMLKFLVGENLLPPTALFKLTMKKPSETDTYCYRSEEVAAMFARCRDGEPWHWLRTIIVALAYTGMRISELASLRWSDIDFERNLVVLTDERHSAARRKRGDARELKGKRSRSFPVHDELRPVLAAMSRSQDGRVFHGPLGGMLKPDTVRRCLIRDVLKPLEEEFPTAPDAAVGFVDGRLHSFRHFFCSLCANSGVPEQTLMTWLGHRSSKMIRRYYHLHDPESQRAMKKVQSVQPIVAQKESA